MRRRPALALAALLAAGCSVGGGVPGGSTGTVTTEVTTTTTAPPPVLCLAPTLLPAPVAGETEVGRVPGANPVAAAIGFSAAVYECAADVVIVSTGDLGRVALAARLAAALEGPLLFGRAAAAPALEAELARLIPQRVWQVGDDVEPGALPEGTEVELLSGDPWRLAEEVSRQVGGGPALVLPETGGPEAVAVTVQAMAEGSPLEPPPATTTTTAAVTTTGATTTSAPPGDGPGPAEGPVPVVLAGSGESGVAWLVEAG